VQAKPETESIDTAIGSQINIIINGVHYRAPRPAMTGAELAALASVPAGNQLFLEVPGPGDDRPIGPDQPVELRSGMRFYDVPVGNLG
jgi:Multiubiquitin